MINRCYNPATKSYGYYGGRGIIVCDRWRTSFNNFISDMGWRPDGKYSIERINNNGNYEPGNCRWATTTEQARNKINTRFVTWEGRTLSLKAWAEEKGIGYHLLWDRIVKRRWSLERAFGEEKKPSVRSLTARGETKTVAEWAAQEGLSSGVIFSRLSRGWSPEAVISPRKHLRKMSAFALSVGLMAGILGCSGLMPGATVLGQDIDPRCATADRDYRSWHAVGIVFTSLGTAATGGGIAADFATDEKWVGIGLDLFGIASSGLGLAGHLLADDAAEDVVRYCEGGE